MLVFTLTCLQAINFAANQWIVITEGVDLEQQRFTLNEFVHATTKNRSKP